MYRLGQYTLLTCSCSRGRSHSEAACRPIPLAAPDRLTAPPSITPASRCSCSALNAPKTQISRLCGSRFTAEMASTHHTRFRWGLNAAPPHHCRPPISDLRRRDKSPASFPKGDVGSATRASWDLKDDWSAWSNSVQVAGPSGRGSNSHLSSHRQSGCKGGLWQHDPRTRHIRERWHDGDESRNQS